METSIGFSQIMGLLGREIEGWLDPRDTRRSQVPLKDMVLSGLACMFYQDASLLQFQRHLADRQHQSNVETQFKINQIPSDTQIREVLDRLPCRHYCRWVNQLPLLEKGDLKVNLFFYEMHKVLNQGETQLTYKSSWITDHIIRQDKHNLWTTLRSYIRIIVFPDFETLLAFALQPRSYQLLPLAPPLISTA